MTAQKKTKRMMEFLVDTKAGIKNSSATLEGVKTPNLKNDNTKQMRKKPSIKKSQKAPLKKKTSSQSEKKELAQKKEKRDDQIIHSQSKEQTNLPFVKKALLKTGIFSPKKENKTQVNDWNEDVLKVVEARKIQMMSKPGIDQNSSPLQMHLVRSEGLRIAQDKITDLEENIHELRQKNESLVSASEVLKDKNDLLKSKLEDLKYSLKEEKNNFKDEKEVLLSALEEAKAQINQINIKKQELEKRLSRDLYGIRARESSLESRIEILKMENSVLQREKDKKIIELKKQIQKTKDNLDRAYKKNQDLQVLNNKLEESSRRTVSALRATIYNLENVSSKNEETIGTDITEKK